MGAHARLGQKEQDHRDGAAMNVNSSLYVGSGGTGFAASDTKTPVVLLLELFEPSKCTTMALPVSGSSNQHITH